MAVFVLDKQKTPLMPCTEKRARLLLERGRAVVVRLAPFTIRLKDRIGGAVQPLRLKLDPGIRVTGLALVRESETCDPDTGAIERLEHGLWFGELAHRGQAIREALRLRRHYRRARRSRKTRYRAPHVLNRSRREGWLPPSLQHRLDTTVNWVQRLRRLAPITALSQELVRFDPQALQNPEISGVEYQQGELAGYEVREYLLEKWNRRCAYCGATHVPLEIEHVVPRARGGSSVDQVRDWNRPVLAIRATGRGAYSRTRTFNNGFPCGALMRHKRVHGFQTGDWVRAVVPKGKKAGVHVGRIAVRQTGSFNIQSQAGTVQGISYRHCHVLQRADGYGYAFQPKPDTEEARRAA